MNFLQCVDDVIALGGWDACRDKTRVYCKKGILIVSIEGTTKQLPSQRTDCNNGILSHGSSNGGVG